MHLPYTTQLLPQCCWHLWKGMVPFNRDLQKRVGGGLAMEIVKSG